jgi:hypothetical protein
MLKTTIAALTVSAAAVLTALTAAPSFAATSTPPLVIGPQVTITVSCTKDHHAVDHSGKLSCVRDKKHHKAAKPATRPAPAPAQSPWSQAGAVGQWQQCWQHQNWPDNSWVNTTNQSWL